MVRDLDFGIEVVELPIVREADGLAMSSRNVHLSAEERQRALRISEGLKAGLKMLEGGERDTQTILGAVREKMAEVEIDYVDLVDAHEITLPDRVEGDVLLAAAARVGNTRLIDNVRFTRT